MNINKWISALAALAVTSAIAIAAQQTIGVGTVANDGTGDPIRTAFGKANDNFTELYARPQGTVTSIATACGVSGGTITTTGTIQGSITANAQTGTSYTPLATDCGKLVTISNASAIAITLTNANFSAGNFFEARVLPASVGAATFTPSSGTIDAGATLVLQPGQGTVLIFDGTNWQTMGQYTTGPSSSTAGNFPSFTGTGGQRLQDSGKAAPTGAVVGTTDSQTLTNKSIVATQLTGTVNAAQMPALTGDCTTSAGAVATACPTQSYLTGAWYAGLASTNIAGNTTAASTIYCSPGRVNGTIRIDNLAVLITTGSAGNMQLAAYKDDGAGRPGALITSSASINTASTGAFNGAASAASVGPGTSNGGNIWWCSNADNTGVVVQVPNNATNAIVTTAVGSTTLANVAVASNILSGVSCATTNCTGGSSTFGSWPATLAGSTWSDVTAFKRAPFVWFRALVP